MNSILSLIISVLLLSIISIQLTSSASFPNPPPFPPPNASPDEWTTFWKLLHNYYAIIARPRFGKRYDAEFLQSKPSPLLTVLRPHFESSPIYENGLNYMLNQNNHHANDGQKMKFDDLYTLMPSSRIRRRR